MRHLLVISLLLAAGCGGNTNPSGQPDVGVAPAVDAGQVAGPDATAALPQDATAPGPDAEAAPDAGTDAEVPALDASAQTPPDASVTCPPAYPLERYSGKPVFQVKVNSGGPYRFAWDTGAPTSVLDSSLATSLGDPPYRFTVAGRSFTVWKISFVDMKAAYIDLDGMLGTDLMSQFAVTLDPGGGNFWLDSAPDEATLLACGHAEGAPAQVPLKAFGGYFYVQGKSEGLDGWYLLDTGASFGAMPKKAFDELQAAHERPALQGFYTPAMVGTFWAKLTACLPAGRSYVLGGPCSFCCHSA